MALLAKHVEGGGSLVHLNTLKNALKVAGFVSTRTRHSLKERNKVDFRRAPAEIELLRAQAQAGDLMSAYVHEAGFAQLHPNRSSWTPQGGRHLIEAKRGKRLNAWLPCSQLLGWSALSSGKRPTRMPSLAYLDCLRSKLESHSRSFLTMHQLTNPRRTLTSSIS